jgi:hypothetical protein
LNAAIAARAREELPRLNDAAPETVAAMSADEVALRWLVRRHQDFNSQWSVLYCLPPPDAIARLQHLQADSEALAAHLGYETQSTWIVPLNAYIASWATTRRIEALRVVEAVRHHAAANGGSLPPALAAITDVPVPRDPLTDEPFHWHVEDGVGLLSAATIEGVEIPSLESLEYRVRLR